LHDEVSTERLELERNERHTVEDVFTLITVPVIAYKTKFHLARHVTSRHGSTR